MAVLTIVTQTNGETVYFSKQIPKVHYMKLISCTIFHTWYTLKIEAIHLFLLVKYPRSLQLAKEIDGLFAKYQYHQLETETNQSVGQLVIHYFGAKLITIDHVVADLVGIWRNLQLITHAKRITYPTTYFLHCDLIDKDQNLFSSKNSDVLAGLVSEKV